MKYGAEAKLEWNEERLRNEEVEVTGVNIFFSSSLAVKWRRENSRGICGQGKFRKFSKF